MQVLKDSDAADIRTNYLRLSRLVHPDKCPNNPSAADASAVLNQAKDTLTNPLKKPLYDAYVTDVTAAVGEGVAEEMTYADWEAAQSAYPVRLPAWLAKILSIPVLGQIISLVLVILLIPLILIVLLLGLVLGLVLYILCLPIDILCRCCLGSGVATDEEERAASAASAEDAAEGRTTAPAQQQPATRTADIV